MKLRLGTRGSELARTQSGHVADALRSVGHEVELVTIRSDGDVTAGSLLDVGGLGVFAASLRRELLAGRVDLAVHSLKDLPTAGVEGLVIAAIPPREDATDALCARDGLTLAALPAGARIGTGSPRRAAQLRARRPDVTVVEIRGNVGTRLARVHCDGAVPGDLDAVVLATAGLARLGRADAITDALDLLPAPGQGALAVECRADDAGVRDALACLDDPATRACVTAERTVLADLAAGCAAPVACRGRLVGDRLELVAAVFDHAGTTQVVVEHAIDLPAAHARSKGVSSAAVDLGHAAASDLLRRGAARVTPLAAARSSHLADFHDEAPSLAHEEGGLSDMRRPFHQTSELWAPGTVAALVGRRILLPRSDGALADAIRMAGAAVDCVPVTTTRALPFSLPGPVDWLVLTSPTSVRVLVDADVDLALLGAHIAAVGPATAAAVRDAGGSVDLVCEGRSDAGALLDAMAGLEPGTALLPCSALADPRLADGLDVLGWDVEVVPIYTTDPLGEASIPIADDAQPRVAAAQAPELSASPNPNPAGWTSSATRAEFRCLSWPEYDAVVLTAGSIARAAVHLWGPPPPDVAVIAFGEPTSAACADLGIEVSAVAATQDGPGVVAALAHALTRPPRPVRPGADTDTEPHAQEDR